jgi:hypothetical protein
MKSSHRRRSSKVAELQGASDDVEPPTASSLKGLHLEGWSRPRWLGSKKLRKRAVKSLESLVSVNLCALGRRRGGSLFHPEISAASDGWRQVTERIGLAFCKFRVALVRFQVLPRDGVMAHCAHLSCFTISAASGNRLRHFFQSKSQGNRSNHDHFGRPSLGACLRQLGFLFKYDFQLQNGGNLREHSGAFWEADGAIGAQSRAPIRRLGA